MIQQMYQEVADLLSKGKTQAAQDAFGKECPDTPMNQIAAVKGQPYAIELARALLWIAAAWAKQQDWEMVKTVVADYHAQIFMWPQGTKGDMRFKAFLVASNPESPYSKKIGVTPESCERQRLALQVIDIPEIEGDMWYAVVEEAYLQKIDQLMDAENWPEIIAESTKGIKMVEDKLARNSDLSAVLGPYLSRLYGCRGIAYCEKGSNAPALQDIDKALAMPAVHRKSEADTGLRFYKARIENEMQKSEAATVTGPAEASIQKTAQLMQSVNLPEAFAEATKGIRVIEEAIAEKPESASVLGPYLFKLYGFRAAVLWRQGSNSQALQDIETASAMPATYRRDAQIVAMLQEVKMKIEEQAKAQIKPAGVSQAQSSHRLNWRVVALLVIGTVYMLFGALFAGGGAAALLAGIALAAATFVYVRLNTR